MPKRRRVILIIAHDTQTLRKASLTHRPIRGTCGGTSLETPPPTGFHGGTGGTRVKAATGRPIGRQGQLRAGPLHKPWLDSTLPRPLLATRFLQGNRVPLRVSSGLVILSNARPIHTQTSLGSAQPMHPIIFQAVDNNTQIYTRPLHLHGSHPMRAIIRSSHGPPRAADCRSHGMCAHGEGALGLPWIQMHAQ